MSTYKPPGKFSEKTARLLRPAPFTGAWSMMELGMITLCMFRHEAGLSCRRCVESCYDNGNTNTDCKKFQNYYGNQPWTFYNPRIENIKQ